MKAKQYFFIASVLLGYALTLPSAYAALDDATILAIFDQANSADIATGKVGIQKGQTEEVRALGRMVVADHTAVQQMGRDLAKQLGITPTPPAGDKSVEASAQAIAALQAKSAAEFDKAYLTHEIAYHQAVIDAIKGTLLPAIQNPQLKKLVLDVLPGFEHHLAATKAAAEKIGLASN